MASPPERHPGEPVDATRRVGNAEPGQLLGAIFASSQDAVVVVDEAGVIVLANPAVTGLFGYYPEELLGASIETLLPLERRGVHAGLLASFFEHPHAREMGAGQNLAGRRRDGVELPVDVSLAPVSVRGRRYAAAFVRDATERQRAVSRLRAVNEITRQLLAGSRSADILPRVAASARELSRSDAVWIVLPNDGGDLEIVCADGPNTDLLVGEVLSAETSRSADVMRTGEPQLIGDLSSASNVPPQCAALNLGPGLFAPLVTEERRLGALVFGRVHASAEFSSLDVAFAQVFAGSITAAIVLAESRGEVERLGIVAEEERIARDLHDTVIQQVFALGMSLQAIRAICTPEVAGRLDRVVDGLDDVIRQIRTTIFRLPARGRGTSSFRDEVLRLAELHRDQLGFAPRVAFEGPVDAAVSEELAQHVLGVVAEGLSNVARHASASMAEALVAIRDGFLEVYVVDDGKGVADGPTAGNGVRNLMGRAGALGGTSVLRPRDPRGTILEWRVPL